MKMPNTRYGDREAFVFYAGGRAPSELARTLRRSERSIRDWLSGRARIPWWIPELLRLRDMERREALRQMGIAKLPRKLGIVSGDVIHFPKPMPKPVAGPIQPPGDRQQEAL